MALVHGRNITLVFKEIAQVPEVERCETIPLAETIAELTRRDGGLFEIEELRCSDSTVTPKGGE